MVRITVDTKSEGPNWEFEVVVDEGNSKSSHSVTMSKDDYLRITNEKMTPVELIERSFEFLLEREPKEAIMSSFDITIISTYFPDYKSEIIKL